MSSRSGIKRRRLTEHKPADAIWSSQSWFTAGIVMTEDPFLADDVQGRLLSTRVELFLERVELFLEGAQVTTIDLGGMAMEGGCGGSAAVHDS